MILSPPLSPSKQTQPGSETPKRPRAASSNPEPVKITVKYDFGWDKRGNGFTYDSHSGRGAIFGNESNKILGYDVVSSYCAKCARGHPYVVLNTKFVFSFPGGASLKHVFIRRSLQHDSTFQILPLLCNFCLPA